MNTSTAFVLAALILGGVALDATQNEWQVSLLLSRKFVDFVQWLAFWR